LTRVPHWILKRNDGTAGSQAVVAKVHHRIYVVGYVVKYRDQQDHVILGASAERLISIRIEHHADFGGIAEFLGKEFEARFGHLSHSWSSASG
jgi:hypothetical protein